jgi:HPt (histidine-containing phosphotransfer) domain-containing protein
VSERPVLDPTTLKELRELSLETDPRLLVDMTELFFDTAPLLLLTIRELHSRGAAAELSEQVHALKSLCGNFGALLVVEKCQVVETLAKADQLKAAAVELPALYAEYSRLEAELGKLLEDEKKRVA